MRAPEDFTQIVPMVRPTLEAASSSFSGVSPQSSYNPLPVSLQAAIPRNGRSVSPVAPSTPVKQSARGLTPTPSEGQHNRRDHNVRVSFFDPSNQATLDRLIAGEPGAENAGEGEEESAQATMTSVEEMLEGYEWASEDVSRKSAPRSTADLIEARLLDELMALEKVIISLIIRPASLFIQVYRQTFIHSWNPTTGST